MSAGIATKSVKLILTDVDLRSLDIEENEQADQNLNGDLELTHSADIGKLKDSDTLNCDLDTGSHLDALLHKINTIVDYSDDQMKEDKLFKGEINNKQSHENFNKEKVKNCIDEENVINEEKTINEENAIDEILLKNEKNEENLDFAANKQVNKESEDKKHTEIIPDTELYNNNNNCTKTQIENCNDVNCDKDANFIITDINVHKYLVDEKEVNNVENKALEPTILHNDETTVLNVSSKTDYHEFFHHEDSNIKISITAKHDGNKKEINNQANNEEKALNVTVIGDDTDVVGDIGDAIKIDKAACKNKIKESIEITYKQTEELTTVFESHSDNVEMNVVIKTQSSSKFTSDEIEKDITFEKNIETDELKEKNELIVVAEKPLNENSNMVVNDHEESKKIVTTGATDMVSIYKPNESDLEKVSLDDDQMLEEIQAIRSDLDQKEMESDDDVIIINDLDETNEGGIGGTKIDQLDKDTTLKGVHTVKNNDPKVDDQNSDDEEIVFEIACVNTKEGNKDNNASKDANEYNNKEPNESSEQETIDTNDDVVLLLEDEDDMTATKTEIKNYANHRTEPEKNKEINESIKQNSESSSTTNKEDKVVEEDAEQNKSALLIDDSDNARDQFDRDKDVSKTKIKESAEINSNSSSNLLRPTNKPAWMNASCSINQVEDADGDIEIIDDADEHNFEKSPSPKRLRLSTDSEDNKKSATTDDSTNNKEAEQEAEILFSVDSVVGNKRTHDVIEKDIQEVPNELLDKLPTKKVKTENKIKQAELQEDIFENKNVPIYDLYPEPKFAETVKPIKLEYFKRFKHKFDKMTRIHLEELVLQKIVEAISYKSEFAEIRQQLEKQENTIALYRKRFEYLTKQYNDLDIVHKRLIQDLQEHNKHFITPVLVTRAVGIQVGPPYKKILEASLAAQATGHTVIQTRSSNSVPTLTRIQPKVLAGMPPGAETSSFSLTSEMAIKKQTTDILPIAVTSTTSVNSNTNRRGCIQKITPQRPINSTSTGTCDQIGVPISIGVGAGIRGSTTITPTSVQRKTPPTMLNKNTSSLTPASNMQKVRTSSDMSTLTYAARQPQLPNQSTQNTQQVQVTVASSKVLSKPTMRRSESVSTPTTILHTTNNAAFGSAVAAAAATLTAAKPKEKAVIDLTDEDESEMLVPQRPPQMPFSANTTIRQITPQTSNMTNARQIQFNTTKATTSIATPTSATGQRMPTLNRASQFNGTVRVSNSNNVCKPTQKAITAYGGGCLSTPSAGTSITRVQLSTKHPATTRFKYTHPAPLPYNKAQPYNPEWKLPPSRPTIRIHIQDNGIVISWTMDDNGGRHSDVISYQIYAYQETNQPPQTDMWRLVGDVKAMLLPMAVTLNQFQENQRYYFAVRAVDVHHRVGPFSIPKTWT